MEKDHTKESFSKILQGLIIFLFLFHLNVFSEKLFWQNKKPLIVGLKSFVIPGWGQLCNKKYIKSGIFFILGGGGTLFSIWEYNNVQNEFNLYSNTFLSGNTKLANEQYNSYVSKFTLFQYTLTTLIVFWFINGIDAVFDAHFINVQLDKKEKLLKVYIEKKF